MFNELFQKLNRPKDMAFEFESPLTQPVKEAQGVLASLGNQAPPTGPTEQGGIRGWLSRAAQQGGFFERLGTFGAELQDIDDGGNRGERRSQSLANRQAQQEAQQGRMRLNTLAQELNMSPRERLLFQADPEAWAKSNADRLAPYNLGAGDARYIDGQEVASRPEAAEFFNTRDGIVQAGPGGVELAYGVQPEALQAPTGYRYTADGSLELIPGYAAGQATIAGGRRAPPRVGSGRRQVGGASSSRPSQSVNPAAVSWD